MGPRLTSKVEFFSDLNGLDTVDDEVDEDVETFSDSPKATSDSFQTSRKRKPSSPLLQSQDTASIAYKPSDPRSFEQSHGSTQSQRLRENTRPVAPPSSSSAKPAALQSTASKVRQTRHSKAKSKGPRKQKGQNDVPEEKQVFRGLTFFFIPNKDDSGARKLRIARAEAHGATWARSFSKEVTHIIVEAHIPSDRAVQEFGDRSWPPGIPVVNHEWLIESMQYLDVRDCGRNRFQVTGMNTESRANQVAVEEAPIQTTLDRVDSNTSNHQSAQQEPPHDSGAAELDEIIRAVQKLGHTSESFLDNNDLDESQDGEDSDSGTQDSPALVQLQNAGFQCMEAHTGDKSCPNAKTIEQLEKMANFKEMIGDQWRTRAYRNAISALKKQPTLIRTKEEALKLRDIGPRLARKIEEIVQTGALKQLEAEMSDPLLQLLAVFTGVYGAGKSQALSWIAQGHRSLDDLKTRAKLTTNQRIGLEHYDDFAQRIPREEVEQHAAFVQQVLLDADPEFEVIIGGSYRRGQKDSGDIDLLITKDASKEQIRKLVLEVVVPKLFKLGFLKAGLATGSSKDESSKFHGASALPGSRVWRRLDLLFVPDSERGAALLYFTGNDIFNRSIRLLASKKEMRLNQHGLFGEVMRGPKRVKVTEGKLLEGKCEKRIFKLLGVPWRPPEHRRC